MRKTMQPVLDAISISLLLSTCILAACSPSAPGVGSTERALTAAQCVYLESNGKTTICHATSSAKNPYVRMQISESGCINGHANHPKDFIDVGGGNCNNAACLPDGAPCDPTLGCCGNLTCTAGTCRCAGGLTFCPDAASCIDLQTDTNNCGGCGNVCAMGSACQNNSCVASVQCCTTYMPAGDGNGQVCVGCNPCCTVTGQSELGLICVAGPGC